MNDKNRSMPLIALPERTETGNYFVSNYPPYSAWSTQQVPEFERALQSPHDQGPLSLYVHVPFCRQRCMYCYFKVHPRRPAAEVECYVDALLAEASLYAQRPASVGRPLSNVYFGGGTPSLLQGFHYQNVDTYEEYLSRCAEGALPLRRAYGMSSEERLRREFVLQLKTGCVDTQSLNRKFGIDLQRLLQVPLQRLIQEGFLTLAPESVRLTRKGLLVVDWLLPEFYLPHHQRIRYT